MRSLIPNALSISRIVLAVAIISTSTRLNKWTFLATTAMLVAALITDALDGYLARRWNTASENGYVLDTLGDRAIHLALVLVFLVRYSFHPIFVFLLVFRDIGIYAVRVLSKDWLIKSRVMRPISLLHSVTLRVWIGLFVLRDGVRVFSNVDRLGNWIFQIVQLSLLCASISLAYYGLYRSFTWLIDKPEKQ